MAKRTESKNDVPNIIEESTSNGELVLYQLNDNLHLEVKLYSESVWLNQVQIATLFGVQKAAISKHMKNIFACKELLKDSVVSILETTASDGKKYRVEYYNLDMILSIGYRVNSINATKFRQWANNVLKAFLLKGYSVNHQIVALQERVDQRITQIESQLCQQQKSIDFFVRTNMSPTEMVFYNGDFFVARVALENLIKQATNRVIIVDPYIDAETFDLFDVRQPNVYGAIYTKGVSERILRLQQNHNGQLDAQKVDVFKWQHESHDRWLIIDENLYHCGHSLNAVGRKISAITLMGTKPEKILEQL